MLIKEYILINNYLVNSPFTVSLFTIGRHYILKFFNRSSKFNDFNLFIAIINGLVLSLIFSGLTMLSNPINDYRTDHFYWSFSNWTFVFESLVFAYWIWNYFNHNVVPILSVLRGKERNGLARLIERSASPGLDIYLLVIGGWIINNLALKFQTNHSIGGFEWVHYTSILMLSVVGGVGLNMIWYTIKIFFLFKYLGNKKNIHLKEDYQNPEKTDPTIILDKLVTGISIMGPTALLLVAVSTLNYAFAVTKNIDPFIINLTIVLFMISPVYIFVFRLYLNSATKKGYQKIINKRLSLIKTRPIPTSLDDIQVIYSLNDRLRSRIKNPWVDFLRDNLLAFLEFVTFFKLIINTG